MTKLSFETLKFYDKGEYIRVNFLRNYELRLNKVDLERIGPVSVDEKEVNSINFEDVSESKAEKKFMFLLTNGFKDLINIYTNKKTTYIHRNSGIPLIGTRFIGIHDRGSTLLEIKPLTGCNANCVFCSVDEGKDSKKSYDFVVEKDYLVEETAKLLKFKGKEGIHIYINPHGEPLLYYDIVELIRDLKKIEFVDEITIITNGMLLTKELIDELAKAGLSTLNISISGYEIDKAKELMSTKAYDIDKIKEILKYAKDKIKVIITPVWIDGLNDKEIEKLIQFAKEDGLEIQIQKFCYNKGGRNPSKGIEWDDFFEKLKVLEEKYKIKLIQDTFKLDKTKEYSCPFKKDEVIKAEVISFGRYKTEKIAVAEGRCILVQDCFKNGKIKLKISHIKDNIIIGKAVRK
jgi:uncharacterized protein